MNGKPFKRGVSWYVRWTDENGQRRKRAFKRHADAQQFLNIEAGRLAEVRQGLRQPNPGDRTFDVLADYYLKNRSALKRSARHDISIIAKHLRPFFGKMLLKNVGVVAVDGFIASRAHLNKKTLANLLTLLISMLNVAVDLGWLSKCPRIRKPKVRIFSRDYRYLRTGDEVRRFLAAAYALNEYVGTFYAVAVYTGLRAGELAGLRWDKVDFEQRLIVVDASFDGPTKAEDVRYVPILDALLPVLRSWRLKVPGNLLFPNQNGAMHQPSARIFQETLHRVLVAAGFQTLKRDGKDARYIRFHDLRHTFASHWVMNGGDIFKLRQVLGHKSVTMTQRYAHLAPSVFAGDHALIASYVPAVDGAKVIPLVHAQAQL